MNDAGSLFPLDIQRTTASIAYKRAVSWGNWASTAVWGRDAELFGDTNSYLFKSTVDFLKKNHVYARVELVDKVGLLAENIFGRPRTGCRLIIINYPGGIAWRSGRSRGFIPGLESGTPLSGPTGFGE
ncbi:MAG: hypothetical protein ABI882_19920 [Acidobacteriota bacterium]